MNNRQHFILLLSLFIMITQSVLSQDVDSLYNAYKKATKKEQIHIANEIYSLANEREVINKKRTFTTNDSKDFIHVNLLQCMASFMAANTRYTEAISYLEEGIAISKQLNDSSMIADEYGKLATIYDSLDQTDKALSFFEKSLKIERTLGNKDKEAKMLYQMGLFYLKKNRDDAGTENIKAALEIAKQINKKTLIAKCLGLLGEYNLKIDNTEKAIDLINQSLIVCQEIGTPSYIEAGLCRLGMAQMKLGDYKKAEKNLLEALKMSEQLEDKNQKTFDLMVMGDLKSAQNLINEADRYYNKSVERSIEANNYNLLSVLYDKLYNLHKKDNAVKALHYLEQGVLVDDSLYNLEMHDQISAYEVKYQTLEKEHQIILQKEELKRENIKKWLLLTGIILCLIVLFFVNKYRQLLRKRNLELRNINATKDKFFSIISHDLKNPALAQKNALKQLVENGQLLDEKSLTAYYSSLLKSSESQVELLYNLLDWARVQTNRIPYKPTDFDLCQIMMDEIELMQMSLSNKHITLTKNFTNNICVNGDRNMTATAFRNLLTNAIKYTNDGGQIDVNITQTNQDVWVAIHDNGVGMSPEKVNNLFKLDKQESTTGTQGESGSGLGLVVCKNFVERNGGSFTVDSTEGKGSTFKFTIKKSPKR